MDAIDNHHTDALPNVNLNVTTEIIQQATNSTDDGDIVNENECDEYVKGNMELNSIVNNNMYPSDDIKNDIEYITDNIEHANDNIDTDDTTSNNIGDVKNDTTIPNNANDNITDSITYTTLKKYKNLVLCGGGIKGIIHIGVLHALYDIGILNSFDCFIGSSVGGLIIALHSIGYSSAELYDFIKSFDLKLLKNLSIMNIDSFGLDVGHNFEYVIKRLIERKGFNENITLREMYEKTKKKIVLVTVCVNDLNVCYLSHETFPELPLSIAIRMTTSIPFIYCPVQYNGKMYIDGGGLDNYPMSYFESCNIKNGLYDTIGILITESNKVIDKIDNLETYIFRVLQCMMICMTNNCKKGYENNTIEVQTDAIDFTNFGISDELKDLFIINGYKSIINNINKFII